MRGKNGTKPAARAELALRQPVRGDLQGLIFDLGA